MNEQPSSNQVLYVFQNNFDAATLKCASTMIGMGRPDLAKTILSNAKIDASRLAEMQKRSTQITIGANYGNQPQKSRAGASW
jgi:hypothetical protein